MVEDNAEDAVEDDAEEADGGGVEDMNVDAEVLIEAG